jgi:iron complex outermembrane receptor protein
MYLLNLRSLACSAALAWALAAPPAAHAQATYGFNLPAQDLGRSLRAVARRTGSNIAFDPATLRGRRAPPLQGSYSAEQAIGQLLTGSGLVANRTSGGSWVISGPGTAVPAWELGAAAAAPDEESAEILVTGTRIRGATSPSRVIEVTAEQARDAGFTDIGQVIRSIPQNFSGGQNPGVTLGAGGITNQNLTNGSAINLRGLGPDATLTLLNGRRLSYNGFVQAVDVSVVPIGALSRIEVIADGASAIYGSDAVSGVANIILRRDFDGLDTTASYGIPTDGGGQQVQLSGTAGTTWASGGVIAAYEYTHADPIFADQRDYTDYMPDPASIYPGREQHSALISGHQDLGESVEFRVDGLYTHRRSSGLISTQPTQGVRQGTRTEIYAVAPSLEITLPAQWSMTLGGTYARDRTISDARIFTPDGDPLIRSTACYCNTSYSAEIDAEGPVFALPGGDLRAAVGAGYRRNEFLYRSLTGTARDEGTRSSRYAFGELYAPIVGPDLAIPAINRLVVTGALRYEDYGEIGSITTPKLGVIYEPIPDISLRGSWGRSFKAPNLLQQFSSQILYLWSAEQLGGTGFPPGSTVLMPYGGNPDLRPERAETWSATLSFHPTAVPGLRIEVGYFDVDYRDRVLQPLDNLATTFDAANALFVNLDPTQVEIDDTIAASPTGITYNYAGAPFDPANVVAIANNVYANVARSQVSGVDASISYGFALGGGRAQARASATWLDGSQQNSVGQPEVPTVGYIANPAKFRARGGLTWNRDGLTLAGFVNHVGGVINNNFDPEEETGSFTTVDATVRYRSEPGAGILANFQIGLSILNLFDQAPPLNRPIVDYVVNYDSTNYSSVGRLVTLSLTKHW